MLPKLNSFGLAIVFKIQHENMHNYTHPLTYSQLLLELISKFFYRFANFRKKIGIKANIEMLFLPDEMFKQKGNTVKIHFGKPFHTSILNNTKSHKQWAAVIKTYIYSPEFKKGISFEEYIAHL